MLHPEDRQRFEELVLPHVDAAFNLARWLLANRADAEDVTQEALLRAFRFFPALRGEVRPWLLQIVRNSCYSWLEKNRPSLASVEFDEELYPAPSVSPETMATRADERERLMLALESLPARSREIIVLRELEECSYKEISAIIGVPIGTVMSTLSRARERLQQALGAVTAKEAS